jgi:dTDP-4-amino-4,6-dideoxygalactose transaminase
MPSYTFSSTANAFALRGAKIVFIDIRPDTMNMDENLIETAITDKTRGIVPVHYAGVACEMDAIKALAQKYGLFVVEDAAQAILSEYKGSPCGAIGDFGCYSFHETKNLSCGEGGSILIKDKKYAEQAEIIREKGTNRSQFLRGQIDKYSWISCGSSYLPSELNAAYLRVQFEHSSEITQDRMEAWDFYFDALRNLQIEGAIALPVIPATCKHNAHMFYIKAKNLQEKTDLIDFLKNNGVQAAFHYIPLHSSVAGEKYSRFSGEDRYTTKESERLLRLPLYYGLTPADRERVVEAIHAFYHR